MLGNTAKSIVASVVADSIALAVAFGANLSEEKQIAILAFAGSVTMAGSSLIAWVETHHIRAHAAIATGGQSTRAADAAAAALVK